MNLLKRFCNLHERKQKTSAKHNYFQQHACLPTLGRCRIYEDRLQLSCYICSKTLITKTGHIHNSIFTYHQNMHKPSITKLCLYWKIMQIFYCSKSKELLISRVYKKPLYTLCDIFKIQTLDYHTIFCYLNKKKLCNLSPSGNNTNLHWQYIKTIIMSVLLLL